jgi:hypothetical protein
MKKSTIINLVLVSSVTAACTQQKKTDEWSAAGSEGKKKVYMRSDTTASYSRRYAGSHFFIFRPYGIFSPGLGYRRMGFSSSAISQRSNVGSNTSKSNFMRGGFGGSSSRVSS